MFHVVFLLFEYQANLQRLKCLSGKLVTRARACQLLNGFLAVGECGSACSPVGHAAGRRLSWCLTQALADWAEAAGRVVIMLMVPLEPEPVTLQRSKNV